MPKGGEPFLSTAQENPCLFLNISATLLTLNNKKHSSIMIEQFIEKCPIFAFLLHVALDKDCHNFKRKCCSYFPLQSQVQKKWGSFS